MDKTIRNVVPLTPSEHFKLYLPLGVEAAAKTTFGRQGIFSGSFKPPPESLYTPENAFRSFVSKLSQVVDNRRGGYTASSFVVLQENEKTIFLFGSNQRSEEDLEKVRGFVTSLFVLIRDKPGDAGPKALLGRVLWRIILFNLPRIEFYLDSLANAIQDCLADCSRKQEFENEKKLDELSGKVNFPRDLVSSEASRDKFLSDCETLIKTIHTSQQAHLDHIIRTKSNEGNGANSAPWCKLRHYMGRLHSCRTAAATLISVTDLWPGLLANFTVSYIPSSKPSSAPMPKAPRIGSTEDAIKLMSSEADLALYGDHLPSWKTLGLDDAIHSRLYQITFRTIVHSEVLLHHELLQRGITHPSQFFNNWKFIGTSKPTCRLCNYYFSEHPDNMAVRPSHRILYTNWRLPDVFENQGLSALVQRGKILEKITALASQDTLSLLREEVSRGREYATNTYSDSEEMMTGQVESSANVGSVMPLSDEPTANGSDQQSFTGDDMLLYKSQGRLQEAEAMQQRALNGYEKAWGPGQTSTLTTIPVPLEDLDRAVQKATIEIPRCHSTLQYQTFQTVTARLKGESGNIKGAATHAQLSGQEVTISEYHAEALDELDQDGAVAQRTTYMPLADVESKGRNMAPLSSTDGHTHTRTTAPTTVDREYDIPASRVSSKGQESPQGQFMIEDIAEEDYHPTHSDVQTPSDMESAQNRTEYSSASSAGLHQRQLISKMARELENLIPRSGLDDNLAMHNLVQALPNMLKAFSLMIGHRAPNCLGQEIMYFVYTHRDRIVNEFRTSYARSDDDDTDGNDDKSFLLSINHTKAMTLNEKMNRFLPNLDIEATPDPEAPFHNFEETAVDEASESATDEELEYDSEDFEPADTSDINEYRKCIVESSAYEWLRGALSVEINQTPAIPDVRSKIRNQILRSLRSCREVRLSRKSPAESYRVQLEVDWDLRSFVEEQGYEEKPEDAISMAITLTGLSQDCQATTTSQYLSQTWPSIGSRTMQLIQQVLRGGLDDCQSVDLPDQTTVRAWLAGPKFVVEAHGTAPSIAEIAEQLAWLGAALQSSPQERGVCYRTPFLKGGHKWDHSDPMSSGLPALDYLCQIGFNVDQVQDKVSNGQCWHNMFRNPVIVRGYPISRRTAPQTGLEMSLNMMAKLVRTSCVTLFGPTWYLKGFSSMLALAERRDDVLLWHHIHNLDGGRVSYFDHRKSSPTMVTASELENARHVVGWCPHVKLYAGALKDISHNIGASCLPRPHATCVLNKVSISCGKFVSSNVGITVGVREKPVHLSRDSYLEKMRWVSGQYALLWDEGDKRGWLVNGASALLHLVRSSLEDDLEWMRKHANQSDILFKEDDVVCLATPHTPDSALGVLMNEANKELKIYVNDVEWDDQGKKKTYTRFKHLVEKQYSHLEQIMDHQFHIEDQSGLNLKRRARKHLEGWDFRDLAVTIKTTPIYPRLKTLPTIRRGWVDFTREIKAITIFGKGFGEIIRPAGNASMCSPWALVPTGHYYLTACVSDLKAIMGLEDDQLHCKTPISICNGLDWHASDDVFKQCQCGQIDGNKIKHSGVAQVLAPPNTAFRRAPTTSGTIELEHAGAVIFGYNDVCKLLWPDYGCPEEGDISVATSAELSEAEDDFHDSAIGTSPAPMTTNGSEAQFSARTGRATAAPSPNAGTCYDEALGLFGNSSARQRELSLPPSRHAPSETPAHETDHTIEDPVDEQIKRRFAHGRLTFILNRTRLATQRLIWKVRSATKLL